MPVYVLNIHIRRGAVVYYLLLWCLAVPKGRIMTIVSTLSHL